MSINRGMDKEMVHVYNGILFSHKNEIMPFTATWMALEIVVLSEINQTEKDKYDIIQYPLYVESKMDTNELTYKTEIEFQI